MRGRTGDSFLVCLQVFPPRDFYRSARPFDRSVCSKTLWSDQPQGTARRFVVLLTSLLREICTRICITSCWNWCRSYMVADLSHLTALPAVEHHSPRSELDDCTGHEWTKTRASPLNRNVRREKFRPMPKPLPMDGVYNVPSDSDEPSPLSTEVASHFVYRSSSRRC